MQRTGMVSAASADGGVFAHGQERLARALHVEAEAQAADGLVEVLHRGLLVLHDGAGGGRDAARRTRSACAAAYSGAARTRSMSGWETVPTVQASTSPRTRSRLAERVAEAGPAAHGLRHQPHVGEAEMLDSAREVVHEAERAHRARSRLGGREAAMGEGDAGVAVAEVRAPAATRRGDCRPARARRSARGPCLRSRSRAGSPDDRDTAMARAQARKRLTAVAKASGRS